MSYAQVNGLKLYYERAGAGERLLFISGTGADLRNKPNQMDGPLPKGFDMVSYDQRGLGRSDKPDVRYTMADYADDAAGLMDHLGWPDAKVVGVSFGGMVAQELILRHPSRVTRLVLACTSPGGAGGSSFAFHEIEHLKGEERARHLMPISDTRMTAEWAAANPDAHAQVLAMTSAPDPYGDEPGRAAGAHRQLEARADHDVWSRLPTITVPVLLAAGKFDGIASPQSQLNLALQIPGSVLQFFKGGHMFMLQDRAAMPAIEGFLRG